MDARQIGQLLEAKGESIKTSARNGNDNGWQIKTTSGAVVNVYDTGTINVQGKKGPKEKVEHILSEQDYINTADATKDSPNKQTASRKVFVVYGHDQSKRNHLEAMLRRWDLEPLILDQLPSEGQTIIEKLEKYNTEAGFAVVLATPDDEGHRRDRSDEKTFRVRQNVVLELGMMLAHLGRSRVAILIQNQDKMERPSDISGLIYIPFEDNLEKEAGLSLAKEMNKQGIQIDLGKV